MEIAALGLKVESREPQRAADALDRLTKSAKGAETAARSFGNRASEAGRKALSANETAARSADRATASYGKLNGVLATVARRMLAVGAAMFGISAISNTLASFEQSMASVSAITRATSSDLAAMRDIAKELGATTEFSASQAADGLRFLGMAGFDATQSIAALPDVLNLATAAQMDLGRAADISSNIMSAFGIKAEDAGQVADILAAAASRANTDVAQMGDAMKYVGPVAAGFNISMNDAAAAIGALADAGIQGAMGGTGLNRILSSLANPTKQAANAIRSLGLNIDDLNPKTTSLVDIVGQLKGAGLDAATALTIFGARGGPAILALVENEPKLRKLTETLGDVEGEASRMAEVMRDNLAGDFKSFTSALEAVIIELGEAGLIAVLRAATQGFTWLLRSIAGIITTLSNAASMVGTLLAPAFDLIAPILKVIAEQADIAVVAITAFYAPVLLGGLALLTKALAVGLVGAIRAVTAAMMANPIGALVALLVAAGYAVYKFRDQIQEALGIDVVKVAKTAANVIVNSFVAAYEDIKFIWGNFGVIFGAGVIGGVNIAIRAINDLIQGAISSVNSLADAINEILGINIGSIGQSVGIDEIANPYADRLAAENEAHKKLIKSILARDNFAIKGSTDVDGESSGLDLGGGDDKSNNNNNNNNNNSASKHSDDYIRQMRERIALLGAETELEQLLARLRVGSISFSTEGLEKQALELAKTLDMRAAEIEQEKVLKGLRDQQATTQRQFMRELEAFGQGDWARGLNSELSRMEDKYQEIIQGRRNSPMGLGDDELAAIQKSLNVELEMVRKHYNDMKAIQGDWALGAKDALINYADEAANVYRSLGSAVSKTFKGMEDALVQFTTKGKLDFNSLANSIISDMMRIALQQSITGPLASMVGGLFSGGGWTTTSTSNPFSLASMGLPVPGRARGGPVTAGGMYEVNELGTPELLTVGGRQMLMMAGQSGYVTPLKPSVPTLPAASRAGSASMPVNITIKNEGAGDGYRATAQARQNAEGLNVEVLVKKVVASDIRDNGSISQQLAGAFGLKRGM